MADDRHRARRARRRPGAGRGGVPVLRPVARRAAARAGGVAVVTRPTEDRFTGSEPDARAAVALAARALRHLARFRECAAAARMNDTHGLLEWAAVPAAVEINTSYAMLLEQAAGAAAETDAAYLGYLLLIEDIVLDAACDRTPVSSGELAAAAQMLRSLREEAEFSLECTGRPAPRRPAMSARPSRPDLLRRPSRPPASAPSRHYGDARAPGQNRPPVQPAAQRGRRRRARAPRR